MSRKLFVFLLNELETVRLVCQNPQCKRVIELPLHSLAITNGPRCSGCQTDFAPGMSGAGPLVEMANAILEVQRLLGKVVQVEFVLPDNSDDA